ncbi:MAG: DUF2179 domain-containing protein [Bacteroidetes bacterium]|nr:DUF2179 domain-containing protein [Bacteroidota bacterium]MBU1719700.1 DUF2179 domain-containing protein [Bacteroidota bacterium]
MILSDIFNSDIFAWVVLPMLIFISRIIDQSIGIIRLILASKGLKEMAMAFGFFESLIWLLAIGQIMQHLDNAFCYLAYAGGFAMGNYVGIALEARMSIGNVILRVIPRKDTSLLIEHLRSQGYGVTSMEVEGMQGKTKMVFSIIQRKEIKNVIEIINQYNPNAFYTIEEVRAVKDGFFKAAGRKHVFSSLNPFARKSK